MSLNVAMLSYHNIRFTMKTDLLVLASDNNSVLNKYGLHMIHGIIKLLSIIDNVPS